MKNSLIDDIVWWIPFKKLREFIRISYNKLSEIDNLKYQLDSLKIDLNYYKYCKRYINFKESYEYNYIFSIGENCLSAQKLIENKLRTFSSPFDWLTAKPKWNRNNVESNLKIINNKFDNFFNKEDFFYLAQSGNNAGYANSKTSLCFYHDFLYGGDFDKEYTEIKSKYCRRIERVLSYLNSGSKVLMVYIESNELDITTINIKNILNILFNIRNVYNNHSIDILYIKNNFLLKDDILFYNVNDSIHIYELNNCIENGAFNHTSTNKILNMYKIIT